MKSDFRLETDSMGEMRVPSEALYGPQTARAAENFPVSGWRFPPVFIRSLALIKKHAARVNGELALIPLNLAQAIEQAAAEIVAGQWHDEFILDIFQTGSGTSTNMNANEVIASRASQLFDNSSPSQIHPNDHVNRCQSSNDVIPSAIHISALLALRDDLIPALRLLEDELSARARDFSDILKIGRTHLQDATPIRLGHEFSGYARQAQLGIARVLRLNDSLTELPLGGTAVGTGINAHPEFARRTIEGIAAELGLPLREAENHFEAQASRDACVEASGTLKTVAVGLTKISNDIRWLGSGPRCGLGELQLPPTQPGSSIMPGKVNPVMAEMLLQVCAQVIGHDAAITWAGASGNFELNTMMPLIAHNLLSSISILARGTTLFTERCVAGLQADAKRCAAFIEQSLALITPLAPVIGYDRAAFIAKSAIGSGRTVREVASELSGIPSGVLDKLLDPAAQAGR